jgi:mRNA-degrading endonuclease RelE of RelBE toxin-antitoxin system
MSYEVIGSSLAERKLDKLPKPDRQRIYAKFAALEENPRPPTCIKLTGHKHQG